MKLTGAGAKAFLAAPDRTARAALLFGPNRALVSESVEAVAAALLGPAPDPFALTRLQEDEVRRDKALLRDALAAQSLLGGARLVRLRAEGDGAADALLDGLALLESGAPAAAFLLVEGGDLPARSKLRAGFENAARAAAIAFYDEDQSAIFAFAASQLTANGVALTPEARRMLEQALPLDRGLVRGETDKLTLYAHALGRALEAGEVAALLAVEADAALEDATRLAAGGEAGPAVEALERAGVGGVQALRALERRLLRLMEARVQVDEGASPADAGARLKPPVFWKERESFAAQLRLWSHARLTAALDVLWRAQLRAMTANAPQDLIAAEAFRVTAGLPMRR